MVRMVTEESPSSAPQRPGSRAWRTLLAALACALLSGCGTTYVMQAATGQWRVMHERVPIDKVTADPHTPEAVRAQLEQAQAARDFAVQDLGLPDNKSYRSYADIGRPYVVWNVVATPEFSVEAKEWCYPIVGCVAYRGYFSKAKAESFAAGLRKQGLDVSMAGVAAYSTLGHFDDPILNTMIGWG